MHKVTIRKDGLYFLFWDQSEENWIEKNILDANVPISWYLSYPIQLEAALTVREILTLIKPFCETLKVLMIHELAGIEIEKVMDLIDRQKETDSKIEAEVIYLVRIAEAVPTVQGDEQFNFLSSYPILVGLKEIDETGDNDEVYSLSAIDFLDWCDLPFEIDDYVEYINPATEEVMFEGVMNWTLSELIGTILSQTSVTLQVMQNSVFSAGPKEGPVEIDSIFSWIDDLDRILLR
jgi:hypothetical protein